MACIEQFVPDWRTSMIHESSPGFLLGYRGASERLRRDAPSYSTSQYDTSMPPGSIHPLHGYHSENLECMTFPDDTYDLFVTQDVFEHLFHPDRAIKEIARVLKPGGTYIMTVPIQNTLRPSSRRATIKDQTSEITYLVEAVYHGGSLHAGAKSLVTVDWGFDILDYLAYHSGLSMTMVYLDDLSRGIKAEMIEVIMMRKPSATPPVV